METPRRRKAMEGLETKCDRDQRSWQRISLESLGLKDRKGKAVFRVMHVSGATSKEPFMCAEFGTVAWVNPMEMAGKNLVLVTTCGHRPTGEIFCLNNEKICSTCMEAAVMQENPMRLVREAEAA
jgi:hypothetical protein